MHAKTRTGRSHIKKSLIPLICASSAIAFLVGACGSESSDASGGTSSKTVSPTKSNSADDPSSGSGASFTNGVFTSKDVKVQITRYKVIQVGQKGNEYGAEPVIAFWYKTTNLSGARVDATLAWILNLDVYQGSDTNAANKLAPAAPPDDRLRYNQAKSINKGGTIGNAMAYALDDLDTPVEVVATNEDLDVIGKTTFELSSS